MSETFDPLDLDAQDERASQQRELAELAVKGEIGDLVWLMGNKRGRRIVWRLLDRAGVFRLSFAGEATHQTAFNEGQRNEGLRLMALITEHAPDDYAAMLKDRKANG